MTQQAIQPREPQLPALPTDGQVGLAGSFGQEDMTTPICAIVQPTSKSERGTQGRYWFPDGGSVESFEAVVLEIAFTRTLWPPQETGGGVPVCRSSDRREGMTVQPSLVLGKMMAKDQNMVDGAMCFIPCDLCPHYKDDRFARGELLCKPGYTLLLFSEERGPFLFFVKGTAISTVKRMIVSPALMRVKQKLPAEPWRNRLEWKLTVREEQSQKFYVPVINVVGTVSDKEADRYHGIALEYAGRLGAQMAAAVEEEGQAEFPAE